MRAVNAVCEGEAAGFTQRVAEKVCDQVRDRWDLGAALTDDVLRYFYPIARNTGWPLPAGNHDAARSLLLVEGSNASGSTVSP